jgi:PKD repeat protein
MQNKLDSLDYKWKFSDPEFVQIINTEENNKIVTVRFNKRGKHTITLEVTDKYGKTASIKKDIEVQSILRPELNLSVNATTWNKEITFQVQSNEKVLRYDWDF